MCVTNTRMAATNGCGETGISNYDILISPGQSLLHNKDEHSRTHVGNMRFQVDLGLRKEAYRRASDACDEAGRISIIDSIIGAVTEHSVPAGRFLERQESSQPWRELNRAEVRARVEQALQQSLQKDYSARSAQEASTPSPPANNAMPPPPALPLAPPWKIDGVKLPPPLKRPPENADGTGTKRRRSGLLRRAVSDSIVVSCASSSLFKDTASSSTGTPSAFDPTVLPSSMFTSPGAFEPPSPEERLVPKTSMDVVLETTCQGLLRGANHVGNNRFRVLIEIQTRTFAICPLLEKQLALVKDVYDTVTKRWTGRFQCATSTGTAGMVEISPERAQRAIFSMLQNGGTSAPASFPSVPGRGPLMHLASLSSTLMSSSSSNPSSELLRATSASSSSSTTTTSRRSSSIRTAPDRLLSSRSSSFRTPVPSIQNAGSDLLRRRSIEDLKRKQARKAKVRQLESRRASLGQAGPNTTGSPGSYD